MHSKTLWRLLLCAHLPFVVRSDGSAEPMLNTLRVEDHSDGPPACTVRQLLQGHAAGNKKPGGWVRNDGETRPSYNCSCPYYKARYFCPHLPKDHRTYVWKPPAVAAGKCQAASVESLKEDLFPPGYTIFIFGNSHTRQPMQALLCQFSDQVTTRRAIVKKRLEGPMQQQIELGDQCRGFGGRTGQQDLLDAKCFDPDDSLAFMCKDDTSSFHFRNGASLHFQFSDVAVDNKNIEKELAGMGLDPTAVDVIIANQGNGDFMKYNSLLKTARGLKGSRKLILWLSGVYNGKGLFPGAKQAKALADLGVVQFDMSKMMGKDVPHVKESLCKFVEGRPLDSHFCMPGPPDELGILLARTMWAHYQEKQHHRVP